MLVLHTEQIQGGRSRRKASRYVIEGVTEAVGALVVNS